MDPKSDQELFERWRINREQSAFEQICVRHGASMRGVARCRLRSIPDPDGAAEDCVQETFGKLAVHSDPFGPDPHLRNWLYQVLGNSVKDLLRHDGVRPTTFSIGPTGDDEGGFDPADDAHSVLEELIKAETPDRNELVLDCLKALPDSERTLLEMKYLAEFSYEEIASQTGMSHGAITMRLHRARKCLLDCFEERVRELE